MPLYTFQLKSSVMEGRKLESETKINPIITMRVKIFYCYKISQKHMSMFNQYLGPERLNSIW